MIARNKNQNLNVPKKIRLTDEKFLDYCLRIFRFNPTMMFEMGGGRVELAKVRRIIREAKVIHEKLLEKNLVDYILKNLGTYNIEKFAENFFDLAKIRVCDDDFIKMELEERSKRAHNLFGQYIIAPQKYRKKQGENQLKVLHSLKTRRFCRANEISTFISIDCECGEITDETINIKRIENNLNEGRGYKLRCNRCKTRFTISPDLRDFEIE